MSSFSFFAIPSFKATAGSQSLDELVVDSVSALKLSLLKTPKEEGGRLLNAPAPKVAFYVPKSDRLAAAPAKENSGLNSRIRIAAASILDLDTQACAIFYETVN